jgi:hypothetical protein
VTRDHLEALERALDRNKGDDEDAFLGRRMAFRRALADWGDERWQEGYGDGQRDVWESQRKAERAAETSATAGEDPG